MGAERLGRVCGGLTLDGLSLGVGYTLEGAGDCDDRANDFRRKSVLFLQIFFGSVRHHASANPLWILNLSLVRNFLSHANRYNRFLLTCYLLNHRITSYENHTSD